MNRKQKVRIMCDFTMTALLPLLMAYSLVGEAAHELLGITMTVLFILHHSLNLAWFKNLFKGKYTAVRIFSTAVNVFLCIIMILLPVSGIIMSKHVFTFLELSGGTAFARKAHLLCSYWGFVLMSVHLGIHGDMMIARMRPAKKEKSSDARTGLKFLYKIIPFLAAGHGVIAFIKRGLGAYLFLQSEFVFFDFDEPRLHFFADYLAVMFLFAYAGYHAVKLLRLITKRFVCRTA